MSSFWGLGKIVKMCKPKYWNAMWTKLKLIKKRFVFEQYRQTNQRMMNASKNQIKSFETSAEEESF